MAPKHSLDLWKYRQQNLAQKPTPSKDERAALKLLNDFIEKSETLQVLKVEFLTFGKVWVIGFNIPNLIRITTPLRRRS